MTLKVALIGVGRGSSLVRPFEVFAETQITALCDADSERLADVGKAFALPDHALYSNYEDLLNADIDIVVVGTPIQFHAEQAIKALEAGKHVLSEVTAAYTLADCNRIIDAARRSSRIYMMAENNCYLHYIREWKQWVQQGRLGELFYAECEYIHNIEHLMLNQTSGESYWRLQRPPIYYCSHSLGPVLQLMDDRITQVMCIDAGTSIANRPEPGCLNMQVALCRTAKGGVIKLLRSQIARREPPIHYYSLYGTRGNVETDRIGGHQNAKGRLFIQGETDPQHAEIIDCLQSDPTAPPEALSGGHGSTEYYLIRDFTDAILANRLPPIDAVRAAEFTAPGICAHESSLQGGIWVDVPQFGW
jgi:predicted dehydrogenase